MKTGEKVRQELKNGKIVHPGTEKRKENIRGV